MAGQTAVWGRATSSTRKWLACRRWSSAKVFSGLANRSIPLVIVNVQRMGPSTGMPTSPAQGDFMQARWGTHGDHPVIALAPGNVKECFELTFRAFELSEKYRVPVIVLTDEVIGHMREKVVLADRSRRSE